jgi:hypothetical protein
MKKKDKLLREKTNVIIGARLFADGAGDFTALSKLISTLINKGFDPNNIFVVVGVSGCNTLGKDLIPWEETSSARAKTIQDLYSKITPKDRDPIDW